MKYKIKYRGLGRGHVCHVIVDVKDMRVDESLPAALTRIVGKGVSFLSAEQVS